MQVEYLDNILSENVSRGKYKASFFHLIVNGKVEWPDFMKMSQEDFGTLIHEYVHYIQEISTVYGVSWSEWYHTYMLICKEYINQADKIIVPIKVPYEKYKTFAKGKELFDNSLGTGYDNYTTVDDLYVLKEEIQSAKKKRTAVKIHTFDFNQGLIQSFDFGYTCIIESMAHLMQTLFDQKAKHQDVPYNSVSKICEVEYPEIAKDKKKLISICLASLSSQNPGLFFFECLDIAKVNEDLNGLELFELINSKQVFYMKRGQRMNFADFFKKQANRFRHALQCQQRAPLEYYNRVLDSCILQAQKNSSALLWALYVESFPDEKGIKFIFDNYGVPYIEALNFDILPVNSSKKAYVDTAILISSELVVRRLSQKDRTKCPHFEKCNSYQYTAPIPPEMDDSCLNEQWKKTTSCLMFEGCRLWRLDTKDISI